MKLKPSVIGLGKLGASMAAAFAKRGFEVIGVDVSRKAVDMLNSGRAPVQETDLDETVKQFRDKLRATLSHREAILESDISFVIVPTPSNEQGAFSLQYARWAFSEIGRALKEKKMYHNVVLTSTVLPGATRYGLLPILENESGKKCGRDFGLCYSPEFIALGSVIRDFLNPDFTLVGEYDERSGEMLAGFYSDVMENDPPCKRMSLENAELTKISVNTFVTTKITFANMIAELCEKIPGGDVDVVTDAIGADSRIGRKYLTGALGYGGPCFPRDNVALGYIARVLGVNAELAETTDRLNRSLPERIVKRLASLLRRGDTVSVLGLAYKPYSHIIEESQGVLIAKALADAGFRVLGFDPLAGELAKNELKDKVLVLDSLYEMIEQADVLLIVTPDPAFKKIDPHVFKNKVVIDFWRHLDLMSPGIQHDRYIRFGCGTEDEMNVKNLERLWEHV